MPKPSELRRGAFRCLYQTQPHGLHLSIFLGEGFGELSLGQCVLPGVSDAERVVKSYFNQFLMRLQQECTKAMGADTQGIGAPKPAFTEPTAPAEPKPIQFGPDPETESMAGQTAAWDVKPERYSRPQQFGFHDKVWDASLWRDLLVKTAKYLADEHADIFPKAFTSDEFAKRKRRTLGVNENEMDRPFAVEPHGFIETAMGAGDTLALTHKMLVFCGEDPADLWYKTRS